MLECSEAVAAVDQYSNEKTTELYVEELKKL